MRRRGSAWGQCPDQACGVSAFLHPGTTGAQGRPADLPRARTWGRARSRSGHVRNRGGLRAPRRLGSGASPLPAATVSAPPRSASRYSPRVGAPGTREKKTGKRKRGGRRRQRPPPPAHDQLRPTSARSDTSRRAPLLPTYVTSAPLRAGPLRAPPRARLVPAPPPPWASALTRELPCR